MLAARSQSRIRTVEESLKDVAPAVKTLSVSTDVASEKQVDELFAQAVATFGRVDVVVHAAGVLGPIANLGDAPVDEWWQAFVRTYPAASETPKTDTFTGDQCQRNVFNC